MPIYETDELTYEELKKMRKRHHCAVCGARLNLYLDNDGRTFLACWDYWRTKHEGIERETSIYEKEGLSSLNIPRRREIMEQTYGAEKTQALAKYQNALTLNRAQVTEIVETLWGGAPTIEKTKAILLCQTYQLNPLMKHLYLVGYKRNVNGKATVDGSGKPVLDWSIQMGIGATRLLAQRKHNFSYLDMTPRKATKEEIEKILGDTADPGSIYGFVHIKDVDTGAEAFGLRGIKKGDSIKGMEKGNTHLNMACIRAERLALDRQYPGEMPPNIEVVDERFIEPEYKVVNGDTGEILQPSPEPEVMTEEHWCEEHGCAFEQKVGKFGTFYAHKKPEGGWCNESKKKKSPAEEESSLPEPEPESKYSPVTTDMPDAAAEQAFTPPEPVTKLGFDADDLMDQLQQVRWKDATVKSYLKNKYQTDTEGTVVEVVARLNREQREAFFKEISDRLEMA